MSKVWRAMVAMVFVSCVAMASMVSVQAAGSQLARGSYIDPNGAETEAVQLARGSYIDPNGAGDLA